MKTILHQWHLTEEYQKKGVLPDERTYFWWHLMEECGECKKRIRNVLLSDGLSEPLAQLHWPSCFEGSWWDRQGAWWPASYGRVKSYVTGFSATRREQPSPQTWETRRLKRPSRHWTWRRRRRSCRPQRGRSEGDAAGSWTRRSSGRLPEDGTVGGPPAR